MKIVSKENIAWSAHQLSREISQRFVNNNTLVINTTWLSRDDILNEVTDWTSKTPNNKVVILNLFDPPNAVFENLAQVTQIDCNNFCFWLLAVDQFFLP